MVNYLLDGRGTFVTRQLSDLEESAGLVRVEFVLRRVHDVGVVRIPNEVPVRDEVAERPPVLLHELPELGFALAMASSSLSVLVS